MKRPRRKPSSKRLERKRSVGFNEHMQLMHAISKAKQKGDAKAEELARQALREAKQ